jgi:hypothetical protein
MADLRWAPGAFLGNPAPASDRKAPPPGLLRRVRSDGVADGGVFGQIGPIASGSVRLLP